MSDDERLNEAFTELERRADALPSRGSAVRARPKYLLVGASAAAVLLVAGGVTWLSSGGGSGTQPAGSDGAGGATSPSVVYHGRYIPLSNGSLPESEGVFYGHPSSVPAATDASSAGSDTGWTSYEPLPSWVPGSSAPSAGPSEPSSEPSTVTAGAGGYIPDRNAPLSHRFTSVAEAVTTVTVTVANYESGDPSAITGSLTAASGAQGGFDMQIFRTTPHEKASCDDPDKSTCDVTTLPDGSSLALGSEQLQSSPDGVTYQADLIRPDGLEYLMHVSNEADPKGDSAVLSPTPPLTLAQMKDILTSELW